MFCSAIPIEKKRSGYVARNRSISHELVRSAERTTTFGLSAAHSTKWERWGRATSSMVVARGEVAREKPGIHRQETVAIVN
jgi:hypothetical protein